MLGSALQCRLAPRPVATGWYWCWGIVLGLGLMATGCPRPEQPTSAPVQTRTPIVRPAPPEPHAEFQELRRFRNYYRVVEVGEYRHHFVVFYHQGELSTATYEAVVGDDASLERIGDSFGWVTTRPPRKPIPGAVRSLAGAIQEEIGAERSPQVEYLGTYRTMRIQEIVFGDAGGYPPGSRQVQLTLAVSEDLTEIQGPAGYTFDMGGMFRLGDAAARYDETNWIDARVGRQGRPQLYALFSESLAFDQATRRSFEAAALAAARRLVDGAPAFELAELEVQQDPQLLPSDLEVRRAFTFYVNARKTNSLEQPTAKVWFDTPRIFGAEQRIEMSHSVSTPYGLVSFDARMKIQARPIPEGAAGEFTVPVDVDFEVRTRAPHRPVDIHRGRVEAPAQVVVDGDRVLVLRLTPPIPKHTVPGLEPFREFEIHLGAWGGD